MQEDRFKQSLPLVLVFLGSLAAYSYQTGNVLWIVGGSIGAFAVFLLSRLRGDEE